GFGPSEGFADALSRAAAEGKVRPARARIEIRGREALGVEALRIGPPARVAVRDPLADKNDAFARDVLAIDFARFRRLTALNPRGRIEAHRFGDNHARVGKR